MDDLVSVGAGAIVALAPLGLALLGAGLAASRSSKGRSRDPFILDIVVGRAGLHRL